MVLVSLTGEKHAQNAKTSCQMCVIYLCLISSDCITQTAFHMIYVPRVRQLFLCIRFVSSFTAVFQKKRAQQHTKEGREV